KLVQLLEVERVHVGAQPDRAIAVARAQGADDAGLGEAAMHVEAEGLQLLRDEVRGLMLLESRLRMRVQMVPPRPHLVSKRNHSVYQRHRLTLPAKSQPRRT